MYWNIRDGKIEYGSKILIMGIVNVTPDSFSDGGDYFDSDTAVKHALELERDGADIIDIGAQSTRPGHIPISAEEEWARLKAVLDALYGVLSVPISVDTYYPYVAEKSAQKGVQTINDVSGVVNPETAKVVKKYGCGWVIMHSGHGTPQTVKTFFENAVSQCENLGIDKSHICLDMGIGFGKDYDEDMALIANVRDYKIDGCPLLLGTSRKRVIGKASNQDEPKNRVYGNIAADTAAILGGVDIIRLHDVKNEKQGVLTAQRLKGYVRI
ncbi:MAG: dihydropteroate synthase [Clostridiales bacterium]|nr:dihydropteroate synthase [Clostridiales bacterium]